MKYIRLILYRNWSFHWEMGIENNMIEIWGLWVQSSFSGFWLRWFTLIIQIALNIDRSFSAFIHGLFIGESLSLNLSLSLPVFLIVSNVCRSWEGKIKGNFREHRLGQVHKPPRCIRLSETNSPQFSVRKTLQTSLCPHWKREIKYTTMI